MVKAKLYLAHNAQPETPLERAHRRHGKPFGFGSHVNSGFRWERNPSVLTNWLMERKARRVGQ